MECFTPGFAIIRTITGNGRILLDSTLGTGFKHIFTFALLFAFFCGVDSPPPFSDLFLKRKSYTKIWGRHIFKDNFSLKVGGTLPKIVINLPRTCEKLHCKGEPYWFSG